jgi:hypothetical protein
MGGLEVKSALPTNGRPGFIMRGTANFMCVRVMWVFPGEPLWDMLTASNHPPLFRFLGGLPFLYKRIPM